MFRALDALLSARRASPDARPRRRGSLPPLQERNRFEQNGAEQLWRAPAHWRM